MNARCTACQEPLHQEPTYGKFHLRCIERLLRKIRPDN